MKFSRQYRFSERSLLLEWSAELLPDANAAVNGLFYFLRRHAGHVLENLFPAYHSLLIVCRSAGDLVLVNKLISDYYHHGNQVSLEREIHEIRIPVCYDTVLGNDLGVMSEKLNLPVCEIVDLHVSRSYHVFMLGFLPGFPYMGMVHERIAIPRKTIPDTVKRGAVGIAGRQTGIYPANSPGGWHIVGYTPIQIFDDSKENPAMIEPGDQVRFMPIDINTFKKMSVDEY